MSDFAGTFGRMRTLCTPKSAPRSPRSPRGSQIRWRAFTSARRPSRFFESIRLLSQRFLSIYFFELTVLHKFTLNNCTSILKYYTHFFCICKDYFLNFNFSSNYSYLYSLLHSLIIFSLIFFILNYLISYFFNFPFLYVILFYGTLIITLQF